METNSTSLAKIKQPEPSIKTDKEDKKTFNFPHIGVIKTPNISTLPVMDEYVRKQNKNPQIKYLESVKNNKFLNFENIVSSVIVALGGAALVGIIKAIFKK